MLISDSDGKALTSHLRTHGGCTCGGAERLTALHSLRFGYRLFVAFTSPAVIARKIRDGYEEGWREFFGPQSKPRYHSVGGKGYPYDFSDSALLEQLAPVPWQFRSLRYSGLTTLTPAVLLDQLPSPSLSPESPRVAGPSSSTPAPSPALDAFPPRQIMPSLPATSGPSALALSNPTTPHTTPASCILSPVQLQFAVGLPGEPDQDSSRRNVTTAPACVDSIPLHLQPLLQKLMRSRYDLYQRYPVAGLQGPGLQPAEGLHPIHAYTRKFHSDIKQNVLLILSPVWAWGPGGSQPEASFSAQLLPDDFVERIREKEKECRPWKWLKLRPGPGKEGFRRYTVNDWV